MIKNIFPINEANSIPVIEFSDDLEKGKVAVTGATNGKSKLFIFESINTECKVGDKLHKGDATPIFGLLFYKNESIDVVINHLKKLKKIKLDSEVE